MTVCMKPMDAPVMTRVRALMATGIASVYDVAGGAGVEVATVLRWLDGKASPSDRAEKRLRHFIERQDGGADLLPLEPTREPRHAGKTYRLAGTDCSSWPTKETVVEAVGEANRDGMVPVVVAGADGPQLRRQVHCTRLLATRPPKTENRHLNDLRQLADALGACAVEMRRKLDAIASAGGAA